MNESTRGSGDVPASAGAGRRHWVELRIHGVSGTPPESMLSATYAEQVAGERFVRVFRPAGTLHEERRPAPEHVLEVLHWGEFTSGSWRQGLWLLVVPFGLVNAAQFMLPRPTSGRSRLAYFIASAMLRLLGLVLTCTLTLSAALVLMDLVAWRWTGLTRITAHLTSNYTVALAMLVTAAVVVFLFSFGTRMGTTPQPTPNGRLAAEEIEHTDLARDGFFAGDADAPALRRLHLSAGLAVIGYLGFRAVQEVTGSTLATAGDVCCVGLLGVVATVVTFLGDPEDSASLAVGERQVAGRQRWREVAHQAALALVGAAVVLLSAAVAIVVVRADVPRLARARLPGIDTASDVVLIALTVALFVLFISTAALALATRGAASGEPLAFRRYAAGMTAALIAAVGSFLGVGFSAAIDNSAASALDGGADFAAGTSPLLERISYSSGLTVFLLVALGAVALAHFAVHRRAYEERARAAYTFGEDPRPRVDSAWVTRIAVAMWTARLKVFLPVVFWALSGAGLALCVVVAVEELWDVGLVAPFGWLSAARQPDRLNPLINIGSWSLVALAAALVLLGRGAIRGKAVRRGVNVIWDVVAFWPRSAHPFVPPPYSQRVVLGLRDRIQYHLGTHPTTENPDPATHVIVAAHSQGTLITFASLLWLRPDELARVGLVTFGSQLQVAFSRAFPTYVNFAAIRSLFRHLDARWVNLYRDTDAIAGPLLSWEHSPDSFRLPRESSSLSVANEPTAIHRGLDWVDPRSGRRVCGHDWRVLDPTPHDRALQTGAMVDIHGHGTYWDDVDWSRALDAVRPERPLR